MGILWALAALFTLYSVFITIRASFTTGTLVLWLVSAGLLAYCLFHSQLHAFCSAGVGRVLKILFFIGLAIYSGLLAFVAISGYRNTAQGDERAIIVLGAGLRGQQVSDVLRRRLQTGLEAWQANPDAVIVVSGGQGTNEEIPEALAMQRWLLANGVPQQSILVEDKSTSTRENLVFSLALLAQHGISAQDGVAVVTNAFHCYRAGQYAARAGFTNVRLLPASMNLSMALPSYMREVFAVLDLWLFQH